MSRMPGIADHRIPLIDLYAPQAHTAPLLDRAARDLGFFFVAGHRVADGLVRSVTVAASGFFDLPLDQKLRIARPATDISRGYNRLADQAHAATFEPGEERNAARAPDLQESFAIGRVDLPAQLPDAALRHAATAYAPNLWPAVPRDLQPMFCAYYAEMERLAAELMSLCAVALGLPRNFFVSDIDRHASILRAVHYPEQRIAPQAGQWRAGPHTDFGTLTILRTDGAVEGGLQVRDRSGAWLDVVAPPAAFIVNIGDLMRRWTNDRWMSSVHRVVNPARAGADSRRLSLVFFHEPNPDALITCLPNCAGSSGTGYPDIVAADYRRGKIAELRGVAPAVAEASGAARGL